VGEDEFWRMTLREFGALMAQARDRERRENARNARQMALMATLLAPREDRKPYDPADFMPDEAASPTRDHKPPPQDWRDMKRLAMIANAAAGGRVVRAQEE
jgi:hypothetical protein